MMPKIAIVISPNWRDYADKYLADCLKSLAAQNYSGEFELFLADNQSDSASLSKLTSLFKQYCPSHNFKIVANKNNDGFAKGNNDCLKLVSSENFAYVFLLNMDTVIDKNCLKNLVEAIEADKKIGAVQARLMLWSDTEKINSLGNITHFLGFGYCRSYNQNLSQEKFNNLSDICYASGASVLLRVSALRQVGLFDEEFWMYNEDQDLGWRLWLAGWRSVLAADAVVYHKYKFSKATSRYYWLDRNRLLSIFKNYRLATLILISPALILMEIGLLFFSATQGWFKEKLKVYVYFLRPTTWRYLVQARRQSQALRQVSDRQIIKLFSGKILYQEIDSVYLRIANVFFNIYWIIAKIIILW